MSRRFHSNLRDDVEEAEEESTLAVPNATGTRIDPLVSVNTWTHVAERTLEQRTRASSPHWRYGSGVGRVENPHRRDGLVVILSTPCWEQRSTCAVPDDRHVHWPENEEEEIRHMGFWLHMEHMWVPKDRSSTPERRLQVVLGPAQSLCEMHWVTAIFCTLHEHCCIMVSHPNVLSSGSDDVGHSAQRMSSELPGWAQVLLAVHA
jgi:hypothetical protein